MILSKGGKKKQTTKVTHFANDIALYSISCVKRCSAAGEIVLTEMPLVFEETFDFPQDVSAKRVYYLACHLT